MQYRKLYPDSTSYLSNPGVSRPGASSPGSPSPGASSPDQEELNYKPARIEGMAVDWLDFCSAIESIPGGASCGHDGLSAIIMKKGKVPIPRPRPDQTQRTH